MDRDKFNNVDKQNHCTFQFAGFFPINSLKVDLIAIKPHLGATYEILIILYVHNKHCYNTPWNGMLYLRSSFGYTILKHCKTGRGASAEYKIVTAIPAQRALSKKGLQSSNYYGTKV